MSDSAGRQATFDLQVDPPRLPRDLRPMLPRRAAAPFDSDDWLFDLSWGGRRALVFVEAEGGPSRAPAVAIVSAAGREITVEWPSVARAAGALAGAPLVLDGELIRRAPRRGASRGAGPSGPVLVAFDLLALKGRLLLGEPLHRRRTLLEALLRAAPAGGGGAGPSAVDTAGGTAVDTAGGTGRGLPADAPGPATPGSMRPALASIVAAPPVEGDGTGLFRAARAYRLPGIVAKRRDAPYLPGARSTLWRAVRASSGDRPGAGPADGRGEGGRDDADGDAEANATAVARRRAFHLFLRLPL